ncbi:hypothetical protein BsWGS_28198 [Bradybaena similaris]
MIDSNVDKCNDNNDDNMTICGNDGRIVIQEPWRFVNEDEKVEKRCDGCVDESDNENKINCADLDVEGKSMKEICSRDGGRVDKINGDADVDKTLHSFPDVQSTCSESTRLDPSCKRTEGYGLKKYSAVDMHLNIGLLESSFKNIHPGDVCNKYISTEKQTCKRTRKKADSVTSAVVSKASCETRTVRRRRKHQLQDANNNNTSPRSVTSFMGRVPFTFYDCFQEQGLLSLVACIIYTLILMVILSVVCAIIETIKSAVGTENLKKVRRGILRYRHSRMSMAAAGHS